MQTLSHTLDTLQPTALDAGLVFSGKASGKLIQGYAEASAYTPAINSEYIFHESSTAVRDMIVWLMNPADPLYIFGPVGCGKTSCIKQLAARLNYPVFELTGHGRLEFADLIGHLTVQDGNMHFEYGPLSLAMRFGGIMLLNEIDLTNPEVAAGLNSILDGSPLCISENGGELIVPHPMFRFVATANTNGGGDETGLYQGAKQQNLAWLDRFVFCEVNYPSAEVEIDLLAKLFPVLPEEISCKMVNFANEVRKLFMGEGGNLNGAIEVTLSTRTLLRWAELTIRFQPLAHQGIQPVSYALDRALGYRASRETRALLHELAQRIFPQCEPIQLRKSNLELNDTDYLEQELSLYQGLQVPKVVLNKPSNNPSGGKFWQAAVTTEGLCIRWGRWNTVGQTVTIATQSCINVNPVQELLNRAKNKLANDYTLDRTKFTL